MNLDDSLPYMNPKSLTSDTQYLFQQKSETINKIKKSSAMKGSFEDKQFNAGMGASIVYLDTD